MSDRTCTSNGCDRPTIARELCGLHYGRWRISQNPTCSIDTCSKPVTAIGLCNAHYTRKRLHGDPLAGGRSPSIRKVLDHPDGTRTCTSCNEQKPLEQFDRDKNASGGHRSQCKPCRGAAVGEWYKANQERQRDRARDRYIRDVEKIRESDLKRYQRDRTKRIALATEAVHARRVRMLDGRYVRGITWKALRERDGDQCCYCGIVMDFDRIPGLRYNPKRASIEHLTPVSAGGAHDWDNVVLACHRCNLRRNRMPLDQWLAKIGANQPAAGPGYARAESAVSPHHPGPS